MALDGVDRKILRALQAGSALTMNELADAVGLSQTPCWRRVKQLENDGVIARRAVILNAVKLGYPINVFASIRIGKHDEETLNAFEQQVLAHPAIVECFSMSGESDFLMRILAESIEGYERFLKRVLLHLPGVASISSSFALKVIKLSTDVPL